MKRALTIIANQAQKQAKTEREALCTRYARNPQRDNSKLSKASEDRNRNHVIRRYILAFERIKDRILSLLERISSTSFSGDFLGTGYAGFQSPSAGSSNPPVDAPHNCPFTSFILDANQSSVHIRIRADI
jgi:hypothetical protein